MMKMRDAGLRPLLEEEGGLAKRIQEVSAGCGGCGACQRECAFLSKYGTPKEIAEAYSSLDTQSLQMAFECSLCGLCSALCPRQIDPAKMFAEMRRIAVQRNPQPHPVHRKILAYEKRGTSQLFTYYALPQGCETVFFPGCALAGTRPRRTWEVYETMKQWIPRMGIVLDCCGKISHDLGRQKHFHAMFDEMRTFLKASRVHEVIVACPNCFRMFDLYGSGLSVKTVYEILAEKMEPIDSPQNQTVCIHDPCAIRFHEGIHASVRKLVRRSGLQIADMRHQGLNTYCCGEGGAVAYLCPPLSDSWRQKILTEADGVTLLTYCAGCANRLQGFLPAAHLLDCLFDPKTTLAGQVSVSRSPMTYLNRLRLKWRVRQCVAAATTRERTYKFY